MVYQLYSYPSRYTFLEHMYFGARSVLGLFKKLVVYGLALVGSVFIIVYFGMQLGVFNVRGSITQRNQFYGSLSKNTVKIPAPVIYTKPAVSSTTASASTINCAQSVHDCAWASSKQWVTVNDGLTKDASEIDQAANKTGVSARMIAAAIVPEQLRLFTSERETFERYFQPLKALGSMSEFSLGVAGIKQQTANLIEQYDDTPSSVFYPGASYSNLITYPNSSSHSRTVFDRLTSSDHYYSFLYVGLFIKEVEAQWQKSGYNISQRPDVITTLYNIGFSHSQPKSNPEMGGSDVSVGGQTYSFGELGTLFYNSNQLTNLFPVSTP